jgi:HEPN domain-containing protein
MNRSADWLHQARADLAQAQLSAEVITSGPASPAIRLVAPVSDLDALYIPTRYPDSLPEGAPTDHFGRLQSQDALRHARALVDAIGSALADS